MDVDFESRIGKSVPNSVTWKKFWFWSYVFAKLKLFRLTYLISLLLSTPKNFVYFSNAWYVTNMHHSFLHAASFLTRIDFDWFTVNTRAKYVHVKDDLTWAKIVLGFLNNFLFFLSPLKGDEPVADKQY